MEQTVIKLLTAYFAIMSFLGFLLMGADKQRARKNKWRIPERTLLLTAFLGGGIGALLGMYAFRHKTKHLKFVLLLPLAAFLDLFLILKLNHVI
jgi:uncharacterized membrane protein YsdA (DUF1294 family)